MKVLYTRVAILKMEWSAIGGQWRFLGITYTYLLSLSTLEDQK